VGLGLAIVKRLTALLGHPLLLRSRLGHGSVFTVDLPLSDALVGATSAVSEEAGEFAASGLILVVDDEVTIQMAMKSLLEGWGFRAIVAGSCEEILPLLVDCPDRPALIVCDYRLRAHEDGIRVIERLRAEYNDDEIPGMLITGDTAPDRIREAQESGLLLLHKPVSHSAMRSAISHLVANRVARPARRAETSRPASG
jgi:two-component system, sensor histidine kinase